MADELSLVISNPKEGEFLEKITWNKDEFMKLINDVADEYKGLTYTEDQMKSAKQDRAKLNAMKTAISKRRVEVKKAIMTPYDEFEKEVKEVTEPIDKTIAMIDSQVKEYEDRIRKEKQKKLKQHFIEKAGDVAKILVFETIFNKDWLKVSVSLKKACEEIDKKIDRFMEDMKTIETTCEEKYQTAAKDKYMKHLDISEALAEASSLKALDDKIAQLKEKQEEEKKKAAEETKAKEISKEQEKQRKIMQEPVKENAATEGDNVDDSNIEKQENEPAKENTAEKNTNSCAQDPLTGSEEAKKYKASFTVYGTRKQIMDLRQYMIDNNIKFGKVEK